jgi:Asp-tRNA(Asn)/Glu-tRNA(Gln) amidotransferase A subunit family amidase
VTATELTEACLARIQIYNPRLNAFIMVLREHALAVPALKVTDQTP